MINLAYNFFSYIKPLKLNASSFLLPIKNIEFSDKLNGTSLRTEKSEVFLLTAKATSLISKYLKLTKTKFHIFFITSKLYLRS